jgi:hypothetical protein
MSFRPLRIKNSRINRSRGGDSIVKNDRKTKKNTQQCESKFCKEYVKRGVKSALIIGESFLKAATEINRSKNTKFDSGAALKKMKSKKSMDKLKKQLTKKCREAYCNVGCKGTIFEEAKKPVEQKKPVNGWFCDDACKKSKLFGKKLNVLKDDFYEKLKNVEDLKKKGAISGCIESKTSSV